MDKLLARHRASARGGRHRPAADDRLLDPRRPRAGDRRARRAGRSRRASRAGSGRRTRRCGAARAPELGNRLGWLTIAETMIEDARRPDGVRRARSRPTGFTRRGAARHGRLEPRPGGHPAQLRRRRGGPAPARAGLHRPGRRPRARGARSTSTTRCSSSRPSPAGRSRRSRTSATSRRVRGPARRRSSSRSPTRAARSRSSAAEHSFRRVFENDPDIGGRYSVMSYFGLVPAALMGVDVEALLAALPGRRAELLAYDDTPNNSGLWLGLVAGRAGAARAATSSRSSSTSRSRASGCGSSS